MYRLTPVHLLLLIMITGHLAEVTDEEVGRGTRTQPKIRSVTMSYLPVTIKDLNERHGESLQWSNYMTHHSAVLGGCQCHYVFDEDLGFMFVECGSTAGAFPSEDDMKMFFRNWDIQLTQTDSPKIHHINLYNVQFPGGYFPDEISMFYPGRLEHFAVIGSNLSDIRPGCLDDFFWLETIKMTYNNLRALNSGVFDHLGFLESAFFHHNEITFIQKHTFRKLRQLKIVDISHNKICTLEAEAFSDLKRLHSIYLHHNDIRSLPAGTFDNLKNLSSIYLGYNHIETIRKGWLDGLTSLQIIDLSHNDIQTIDSGVFYGPSFPSLQHVDLSFNELGAIDPWPLSLRTNFFVNLEKNLIANFTNSIQWNYTCAMQPLAGEVRLTHNRITHISDLLRGWGFNTTETQIHVICMFRSDSLRVDLRKNPFACDCVDFEVYKYLKLTKISEIVDQLMCDKPPRLYNRKIITVPNEEFECVYQNNSCPRGCTCTERPAGVPFYIDCNNKKIKRLPKELPPRTRRYYRYKLEFQSNRITRLFRESYFEYSDYLDLSVNRLLEIRSEALQALRNVSVIKLNHNNLTRLPENMRDLFDMAQADSSNLKELYLQSNRWICDCHAVRLRHWFLSLGDRLQHPEGILCETPKRLQGRNLLSLRDEDFICGDPIDWQFVTLVLLTIAIASVIVCFYFGWQQVIFTVLKMRIYSITGLHPFDQDECERENIAYDVFLCFLPGDEERVKELKDFLHSRKYRVCLQAQSFRAGEDIFDKAATIVSKSKRTIFLISPDFFTSYINICIADHIFSEVHYRKRFLAISLNKDTQLTEQEEISKHLLRFIEGRTIFESELRYWDKLMYFLPVRPVPALNNHQSPDTRDNSGKDISDTSDIDSSSETTLSITQPLNFVGENPQPDFDLDDSRIYDVFISFAQEQDSWVRRLVSKLEQDDHYRVCVHTRDFVNGIPIWDNIGLALDSSKRLLCVVSQDFNSSTFCMWEFQAGLGMQMAGKHRIIVVLYDQLEKMTLEPALRSYLKRYTYLEKWKPNFMEMLLKDLPASRISTEQTSDV